MDVLNFSEVIGVKVSKPGRGEKRSDYKKKLLNLSKKELIIVSP